MARKQSGPGAAGTATEAEVEYTEQHSDTITASEPPAFGKSADGAMTPLDAALAQIRLGRAPIPVPHRTKAPKLRGWQRCRITEQAAPRYFNGAVQNIGVLLG